MANGAIATAAAARTPAVPLSKADKGTEGAASGSNVPGGNASAPPKAAQARRPPAGDELRPGAVGIGTSAEGLQVRGLRITGGFGRCLASVPVVQDRAYWEVHVVEVSSELGSRLLVGMSAPVPEGGDALQQEMGTATRSYGVQFGAGGEAPLKTGDIIGVAYDQAVFPVSVCIWRNGLQVATPLPRGLKGEQWPALFVFGCTVDWALSEEHWKSASACPEGFSALMPSRGLIGD
eukprot:CAMPEP_0179167518 /NCGR_PEP_ID=MMETSP0796-20121207/82360_1 /TAXON_ID=73915 /ORGANISM="Pyrodinium bahamense, Strain pbaha01" /LENGTH=234 /DNA_ID=CAMNT_0020870209 /DNA_START=152 /DNA_END=856 /DNA_ORIENTATION=+